MNYIPATTPRKTKVRKIALLNNRKKESEFNVFSINSSTPNVVRKSLMHVRVTPKKSSVLVGLPKKIIPLMRIDEILSRNKNFQVKSDVFCEENYVLPSSSEIRMLVGLDSSSLRRHKSNFPLKSTKSFSKEMRNKYHSPLPKALKDFTAVMKRKMKLKIIDEPVLAMVFY